MALTLGCKVAQSLQRLEQNLVLAFTQHFRPDLFQGGTENYGSHDLVPVCVAERQPTSSSLLRDLVNDGLVLFAVPHHRRSVERRMKRKYGSPDQVLKIMLPKSTIRVCSRCGDHHEVGVLCPSCYKRVMDETREMQAKITENQKLTPIDKEVAIVYAGETREHPEEYWNGKRIIEMDKPRPQWFSKNLLQKSTQQPSDSTDMKPIKLA